MDFSSSVGGVVRASWSVVVPLSWGLLIWPVPVLLEVTLWSHDLLSLVDNGNFIAGTRVHSISGTTIFVDRASTNTAAASNQTVRFLGPTTAYTSPAATKSILIGGTFANNTNNSVNLTLETLDASTGITVAIASKIPVPAGSSFVISDTGKTLLEATDELRIYCDTTSAIDASLSILTGVS